MEQVRDAASKRQFDSSAAEASHALLRTGYLMTGDAEDHLAQETSRRWNRVQSMDHLAAYARRILINLVLRDVDRRSRQKAELGPQGAGTEAAESAARMPRESMTSRSSAGRWRNCRRVSAPSWFGATGQTCPSPRSLTSSAARPGRSRAPHPARQPGWPRSLAVRVDPNRTRHPQS
jgi:hypothetical protein